MTTYRCPNCGAQVVYTHGAIEREPWCWCRKCQAMFNPNYTNIPAVEVPDQPARQAEPDTPKERTKMARPKQDTPFTAEDLAKLPAWAQGKVKYLNGQLIVALETLASVGTPAPQEAAPATSADVYVIFDGPPGPVSGRFVECNDAEGHSIDAGEWAEYPGGHWSLRIRRAGSAESPEVSEDGSRVTVDGKVYVPWVEAEALGVVLDNIRMRALAALDELAASYADLVDAGPLRREGE